MKNKATLAAILADIDKTLTRLSTLDTKDRVEALNGIRQAMTKWSPFANEPVDCVQWVAIEEVEANDYNPNSVAAPEMDLLRLSIMADGFTQPIVVNSEDSKYVVVDGFHRNRVGRECPDVLHRIQGYLPTVQIRGEQSERENRIASTIRHNRARGKHRIDAMSDIVVELKRRNWSDGRIGKELGMDPDEVLRLTQVAGLAEMFAEEDFSTAWEHSGSALDESEYIAPVDLEWVNATSPRRSGGGWHDRSSKSSVLYGDNGQHLGLVQQSRFDGDWFWYAYTKPMQQGKRTSVTLAKTSVEDTLNA
jgi:ParB-like chromosome segregation protein Spo0J